MELTQSLISSKYQTVIPAKIRRKLKLKAGDRLIWRVVSIGGKLKMITEPEPKNWAQYTRGLGKKIWEKVDIKAYIKNLRLEWSK